MSKQKTIQLHVPADLAYSAIVRQMAESFFDMNRFNSIWSHRLKLAVDELFMNAVKYGSGAEEALVHLQFIDEGDSILFVIEDHGDPRRPLSAEALKQLVAKNTDNKDLTRTSGRGLSMIVHLWTDHMDVDKSSYGGLRVSFSKTKDKPPPSAVPSAVIISAAPSVKVGVAPAPSSSPKGAPPVSVYTVALKGDIDQYNLPEKSNAIQTTLQSMTPGSELVLDFKSVTYINSLFIGHLAAWHNQIRARGGTLRIIHANPIVKDILDLVGLNQVLAIN